MLFLIFARFYPVDDYGIIISSFALSNIVILFFDFGLPIYLQKTIAQDAKASTDLVYASVKIIFYSFPVYILISFISFLIIYPFFSPLLVIEIVLIIFLSNFINLFSKILFAKNKFKELFYVQNIIRFAILLCVFLETLLLDFQIEFSLGFYLIGNLILTLYLLVFVIKSLQTKYRSIPFKSVIKILKISFPLALAVLFNFLYDKIDIVLISKFTNFYETSYYSVGYGLYKSATLVFAFLLIVGLNKASNLSSNKTALKILFNKYASLLIFISIILNLILFFGGGTIISIIYTDKFAASDFVIKILSFAVLGISLNNLTGVILNGIGDFKGNMYVTLIGLVINVLLNLIFIPQYGIAAAAVITLITEYFIFFGGYYLLNKHWREAPAQA
ncbi:MAG TPA: polysaccharide biosynthesis C-terminal domain-containing protein [Ignavibacteria bacterium]|nr:polysaccharide biosynthesis C-terminal domain-containing protein [Ignavibacteria bacterium]